MQSPASGERAEEFRSLGIDFASLHVGVDTSTPNGRLVFGIFASIAEFERELIRDRVKSGLRNAVAIVQSNGQYRLHFKVYSEGFLPLEFSVEFNLQQQGQQLADSSFLRWT